MYLVDLTVEFFLFSACEWILMFYICKWKEIDTSPTLFSSYLSSKSWNLRAKIQLGFKNNLPLQCRKINWPLYLHWINYCLLVIKLVRMKLLHFVHMAMCVEMVLILYCSWADRLDRKLPLAYTKILTDLKSSFQVKVIGTVYVLWILSLYDLNAMHWHLFETS